MNSQIILNAFDRSQNQIELLNQRHPNLNANIKIQNITEKFDINNNYDISYSQAVIMHIKDGHLQALENMFNVAKNQVVLMENWLEHDFYNDIHMLFTQKRINWDSLYLYINNYQSSNLLIASKTKLTYFKEITSKYELI